MSRMAYSALKKFFVLLMGFILALAALECGLRIAGRVYLMQRMWFAARAGDSYHGADRILALGDSYTFAGNVSPHESYSDQLQEIFAARLPDRGIVVFNKGWCEATTQEVLSRLGKILDETRPRIAILLVGAADRYRLDHYDLSENKIVGFLKKLRLYKMVQITLTNLRSRHVIQNVEDDFSSTPLLDQGEDYYENLGSVGASPDSPDLIKQACFYFYDEGNRQKGLDIINEFLSSDPGSLEGLYLLADFYRIGLEPRKAIAQLEKAIAVCESEIRNNQESRENLASRAYFSHKLAEWCCQSRFYDLAIENIFKALKTEPNHSSQELLIRSYDLQSKYKAADIIVLYDDLFTAMPYLREDKVTMNYYAYFHDREMWEKRIHEWVMRHLDEIVKICQERKITLVLQNYPYPYVLANTAISQIARKYSLPLIDHLSRFEQLVNQDNWWEYFEDDAHCTPKGYSLMAQNVYEALMKGGFLR